MFVEDGDAHLRKLKGPWCNEKSAQLHLVGGLAVLDARRLPSEMSGLAVLDQCRCAPGESYAS